MLFKECIGVDDDSEAKWETHHLAWKLMEIRETIVISISDQFWNAEGGGRGADNKEQDGDIFDNELGYNFRDFDAHGGWKDEKKEEEEDQDEVEDDSVSRTMMMKMMMTS